MLLITDEELGDKLIDLAKQLRPPGNYWRYGVAITHGTLDDLAELLDEAGRRLSNPREVSDE